MVRVTLGAKAKNCDFDVSDVDVSTFEGAKPSYSISASGVTISQSRSDYVVLEGRFKLFPLMEGDYTKGVRQLDSITVVENGKVSYKASDLDITGKDLESGAIFRQFLAGEAYSIKGNGFANDIAGADGKDLIRGLGGNDALEGGAGNDRLFGEVGADRLTGGTGNDRLSGGKGADTFVFFDGDGADIVTDFRAAGRGHDRIDLSGHADVSSFDDLVITQAGASTRIDLGDDTILLRNVSPAQLDASDFLF